MYRVHHGHLQWDTRDFDHWDDALPFHREQQRASIDDPMHDGSRITNPDCSDYDNDGLTPEEQEQSE